MAKRTSNMLQNGPLNRKRTSTQLSMEFVDEKATDTGKACNDEAAN